jgi:hypothetical protein
MHDMDDKTRREILGEVLFDELRLIREYLEDVAGLKRDNRILKRDLDVLKDSVKLLQLLGREHQHELEEHDVRINRLEHTN